MVRGARSRAWVARHLTVVLAVAVALALAASTGSVLSGCGAEGGGGSDAGGSPEVLVTTTYLRDIAQRVAGDRLTVEALFPEGSDPHGFEPTPRDAARIADSNMVIVDILGLQPVVDELIRTSAADRKYTVEAAAGLPARTLEGEANIDPHFWLDPVNVVGYVENIRDALTEADPEGKAEFDASAEAYTAELRELDTWIATQVEQIPPERRLLVTNHESFGYFADRYGFKVVGTVFGNADSQGVPSAQQLTGLVETIRATGAPAIFLETGGNGDLAEQVARETGVTLVTDLYLHSVGKDAPTYVDMMRWNTSRIVEALR